MSHDAVVYDLDGTLIRLAVNWDHVARDVASVLEANGVDPGERGLWEMLTLSNETGTREAVEETMTEYELDGARASHRLELADGLPHDVPVGVCSLNAETACRRALEVHEIAEYVDAVVGRDTAATVKPDPEGLLLAIERLGVAPDETVFVGDSDSDREAAQRADVAFEWARNFDQRLYRA